MKSEDRLKYIHQGVNALLERGHFLDAEKSKFKKTQREAIEAYRDYLNRDDLSTEEKLKGYFEIPTGVGKTALFVGIATEAHKAAAKDGHEMRTLIVEPRVKLLEQTHDSFKKYSPKFQNLIGFYGDGHEDLSKPITVITYEAWTKLAQNKKISAKNIDLLVSDEGHRGTSEGRVETLTAVFRGATGQIAFTATAHFDEDKSVQNSHERQIFYKSLRDCWRDKELAEYFGLQYYVIRATPPKNKKEFNEEARGENETKYRQRLKQAAWNKRVLKIFREGRDEETGDLLSDNKSAFFTDDINHAINIEKLLNADIALQKKAKKLGCRGVAISIHSRLSKEERKKRFEAVEKGEYMAVVGDGVFKEGFDYPPLKNIFDYPRSSLVDKAQIIGRGGRKWWNPDKKRWEGATIIDTIVYVGSDNPEEDKRLRERAIRKAVLAEDITEGNLVLKSGKKKKNQKRSKTTGPSLFADDPDVEEYTTLEDSRILIGERERIKAGQKEGFVEITDETWTKLTDLIAETGITFYTLFDMYKTGPKDLTMEVGKRWLYQRPRLMKEEHLNFILNCYKEIREKGLGYIEFTEEVQNKLRNYIDTTQTGIEALLGKKSQASYLNAPTGLNRGAIRRLIDGRSKYVQKIYIDYIFAKYEEMIKEGDIQIPINEQIYKELRRLKNETGISVHKLLTRANNVPEGIEPSAVRHWVGGRVSKAKKKHLEWLIAEWSKYLNSSPDNSYEPS